MNIPKQSKNEKGQSLVEFAVSAIAILLLLAGAVDFGRLYLTWITLQDAAQEGASYASYVPGSITNLSNFVRNSSTGPINLPPASLTITPTYTGPLCAGSEVRVAVSTPFVFTMPLLSGISVNLEADSIATILYPACP